MTVAPIFVSVDPVVGVVVVVLVLSRRAGVRHLPTLVLLAEDGRHGPEEDCFSPVQGSNPGRNADRFKISRRGPSGISPSNKI